jgi:SM-20-related protein
MIDSATLLPAIETVTLQNSAGLLARDGYVRIESVLAPTAAEALEVHLRDELVWNLTLRQGEKNWDATPAEQRLLGRQRLEAMATAGISDGFRYLFDVVRIPSDQIDFAGKNLLSDQLTEWWGSPAALAIWSKLTGRNDITGVEMMATRYCPGHFLTRHNDHSGKRAVAFVLSLSRDWRAEWGGLLQFLDEEGDIERTLIPSYNSLVLFTIPREHIVSAVAPFAPAARLSVSGWLLAGPD